MFCESDEVQNMFTDSSAKFYPVVVGQRVGISEGNQQGGEEMAHYSDSVSLTSFELTVSKVSA